MQPFSNPSPHLEASVQALNVLNNFPVQIRNPNFKRVRHRELVSVHKEFVGKSGTDLEELHSSKLVGLFHKWNKPTSLEECSSSRSVPHFPTNSLCTETSSRWRTLLKFGFRIWTGKLLSTLSA